MKPITDKEHALIRLLKANARVSISELAKQLGISRTTAQQRLQKLEASGVITGYHVSISEQAQGNLVRAYVRLTIDPNLAIGVIERLADMPEIVKLMSVSGRVDYMAKVEVISTARLDELLDTIGALRGVKSTESSIVLKTKFDHQ